MQTKSITLLDYIRYAPEFIYYYFTKRWPERFKGNWVEIIRQIAKKRWKGHFFYAAHDFSLRQFWLRDFAFALPGLEKLNMQKEIEICLRNALEVYQKEGRVYTTIASKSIAYDVYDYGADSLPLLLTCLQRPYTKKLAVKYQKFLNAEIQRYYAWVFDPNTKLVRADRHFSIPKDMIYRKGTAVASAFLCYLVMILESEFPWLVNPFPSSKEMIEAFMNEFWEKDHIKHDLQFKEDKVKILASDPTLVTLFLGVIVEPVKLRKAVDWLNQYQFADPFPLKYHLKPLHTLTHRITNFLLPNYQGDAIWLIFTAKYIEVLALVDQEAARKTLDNVINLVEKEGTVFEVYTADGLEALPGRLGWRSASGMLFGASLLEVADKINYKE